MTGVCSARAAPPALSGAGAGNSAGRRRRSALSEAARPAPARRRPAPRDQRSEPRGHLEEAARRNTTSCMACSKTPPSPRRTSSGRPAGRPKPCCVSRLEEGDIAMWWPAGRHSRCSGCWAGMSARNCLSFENGCGSGSSAKPERWAAVGASIRPGPGRHEDPRRPVGSFLFLGPTASARPNSPRPGGGRCSRRRGPGCASI